YNSAHIRYMKEQIWEARDDLEVYSKLSEFEYEQIKDYIDYPKNIMDLGCGLGRVAVYLNAVLKDPDMYYILADRHGDTTNTGGWDLNEFYNDLNLTQSFCRLNGLLSFEVFDTKLDNWNDIWCDLIVSHCAFGMHFPIENIMSSLLEISSSDITMIFGTRNRGLYSEDSFKD